MPLFDALFGFEGRISRREYWLRGVLPLVFVHAVLRDLIGHEIVSARGIL